MSKVNLIGLSGRISSGKDTVGKLIQYFDASKGKPFAPFNPSFNGEYYTSWKIKKYAYKLKQIASILTGIPIEKFEDQEFKKSDLPDEWRYQHYRPEKGSNACHPMTVRDFLQKLGTEAVRMGLHDQAWINALFADYTEQSKWIITDVRYPNEFEAIKQRGGIVIRVERGEKSKDAHISETALDDFKFDFVLDNNGSLDELKSKVNEVLKAIL